MLSSRDRILNAVEHRQVDKVPVDLGGPVSGISLIAYERLLQSLDIKSAGLTVVDKVQQLAAIDERILRKFNVDTRHVRLTTSGYHASTSSGGNRFKDIYGITYTKTGTETYPTLYYEMTEYPLAGKNLQYIENYEMPRPLDSWLDNVSTLARQYYSNGKAVVADPSSGGILEQSIWLRGFDRFLLDLYEEPEIVTTLLDKNLETQLAIWLTFLEEIGEWASIVLYGDDYGTQERELLHPSMWRELIKPRLKKLVTAIKKEFPRVKFMLHSCGSIHRIIPDLIECGVDILNPVQPLAKNMDPVKIKKEFGNELCLHGGIDTQDLLPKAAPEAVRREVRKAVKSLINDSTGYIFATAHNILADVSAENINAMYSAITGLNTRKTDKLVI